MFTWPFSVQLLLCRTGHDMHAGLQREPMKELGQPDLEEKPPGRHRRAFGRRAWQPPCAAHPCAAHARASAHSI